MGRKTMYYTFEHTAQFCAPEFPLNIPAMQSKHEDDPEELEYRPGGQLVQRLPSMKVPAGQTAVP